MKQIKDYLWIRLISIVAAVGLLILGLPVVIIYPFNYKVSQQYATFLFTSGLMFTSALIEIIFGTNIVVTSGDLTKKLSSHHPTVIIMNHTTIFDLLYLSCVIQKLGSVKDFKIILDSQSKNIPIFGWILQMVQFIFKEPGWTNSDHVIQSLTYYCNSHIPVQLLVFPEEEILNESNLSQDNAFAWKNDISTTKYVLRPHYVGFVNCIQILRKEWSFHNNTTSNGESSWRDKKVDVCDITAGYIGKGLWPNEVHFHIKHYPSSALPSSDEELSKWLKRKWNEKDELLSQFNQNNCFPGKLIQDNWKSRWILAVVLVKWLVICAAAIYCLIEAPLLMISVLGTSLIIQIVVSLFCDGWDNMILRKWTDSK